MGKTSLVSLARLRRLSASEAAIILTKLPAAQNDVTCANCAACCCRLEVLLLTDTGVPQRFIATDAWGGEVMKRLDDGWCAALDRNTMLCTIYERRPLVCREFEMASDDCLTERADLADVYRNDVNVIRIFKA